MLAASSAFFNQRGTSGHHIVSQLAEYQTADLHQQASFFPYRSNSEGANAPRRLS
jgi:hypothetical protein